MPKNNSLKPAKLPMQIRFGEKPTTVFKNNLDAIKVELISAPTLEELRAYLPQFVEATWADSPDNAKSMSVEQKDMLIRDVFFGKTLPTALETINLVFKIDGISMQEVTHLLRYRTASFSADCSGDKWWTHKDALVPHSIQNSTGLNSYREMAEWGEGQIEAYPDDFYQRYKDIVRQAKKLYADMIDSKKVSIMDARYILPRCLSTFYFMRINAKDLIHVIRQRIDKQIQPETDNVIAYRLYIELLKQYPLIKGLIDIHATSSFYVSTARTGKATNLYFPDADSDKFEWNEEDFIYKCRRDQMNGTDKGAGNKFNKVIAEVEEEIKGITAHNKMSLKKRLECIKRDIIGADSKGKPTFELINFTESFSELCLHDFSDAGLDFALQSDFFREAYVNRAVKHKEKVGLYVIAKYVDMFNQLDDICNRIVNEKDSRQLVIGFPKEHCFQSIQFLLRDNKLHCLVNMRSCNFEDNFLMDLYIAFFLAKRVNAALCQESCMCAASVIITMSIGSLHIFKKKGVDGDVV